MFLNLEGVKAKAIISLNSSTRIWVGFIVLIPSSVGHSQWWHQVMVERKSFCHLKVKIQELWWLFCVCVHPLLILLSSLCLMLNTIFLFFFLDSMFVYVCLYLHLYISIYLFLLLLASIYFYFPLFASKF